VKTPRPISASETKLESEAQNLVYTVEIRSGRRTTEVIVDAGTGKSSRPERNSRSGKHSFQNVTLRYG
jgi:hypothetical protein